MSDLPSGTVTFLFTDIEGSTRLLKRLGARYGDLLAEHQRIVREAAAERGGREIDTQGDSFFFAFARAKGAVGTAVLAQRALAEHAWPDGADVRVRMGLHTGEPAVGEDRYVGLGVHRAARIGAVGHGGQVLLSNATRELVEDEPGGVSMRDLGSYRLRDIDRPERLFQLDIEGLQSEFPPLRAEKVVEPRRLSRRALLVAGLAGVLAAAVAIPIFALGQGRPGDDSLDAAGTPEPGIRAGPNSVAVIDPKTNRVTVSIPVGMGPGPIVVGAGSVWVANVAEATLSRIDPKTRKVIATIGVGIEASALSVDGDTVWVAGGRDSALLRIDARNNRVRERLVIRERIGPLPAGYERGPSAVASGEGSIWLAHGEEVSRIDPRTNTVVATIPAGGNWSGALAAGEGAVWVAENSSLQVRRPQPGFTGISRIDPLSNAIAERIPIPGFNPPVTGASLTFGAVAVGEGAVWVAAGATDLVWRIDVRADREMRSIPGGNEPSSVAVGEGAVWVENHSDETVVRIDPFSNEPVKTIAIGRPTRGIAAGEGAVWVTVVP